MQYEKANNRMCYILSFYLIATPDPLTLVITTVNCRLVENIYEAERWTQSTFLWRSGAHTARSECIALIHAPDLKHLQGSFTGSCIGCSALNDSNHSTWRLWNERSLMYLTWRYSSIMARTL